MLEIVGQLGSKSRYIRVFSGYVFPTKRSDRVPEIGHRDIVHRGSGTVEYM